MSGLMRHMRPHEIALVNETRLGCIEVANSKVYKRKMQKRSELDRNCFSFPNFPLWMDQNSCREWEP